MTVLWVILFWAVVLFALSLLSDEPDMCSADELGIECFR